MNLTVYEDGDFTVAAAASLAVFQSLYPNSTAKQQLTQDFVQNLADFVPLALDTPHDEFADYLLVEEGPHKDLGGGKVQWTRTYLKLGPDDDYVSVEGTFAFTFPGFSGIVPGASENNSVGFGGADPGRLPVSKAVPKIVERKFYNTTDPATDIPIEPRFQVSYIDPANVREFLFDGNVFYAATTPSQTDYKAKITAKELIVAEDSRWQRVKGNFYVRETAYVVAQ